MPLSDPYVSHGSKGVLCTGTRGSWDCVVVSSLMLGDAASPQPRTTGGCTGASCRLEVRHVCVLLCWEFSFRFIIVGAAYSLEKYCSGFGQWGVCCLPRAGASQRYCPCAGLVSSVGARSRCSGDAAGQLGLHRDTELNGGLCRNEIPFKLSASAILLALYFNSTCKSLVSRARIVIVVLILNFIVTMSVYHD